MKFSTGITSMVLVLIAAASFVSMISMFKIDGIVHGDLYRYGLHFSHEWAMPYWTLTTIVFGVGWFNIIVAVAFQFYVLIYGRKEAEVPAAEKKALRTEISQELQSQPQPIKEERAETEAKPIEKVEEYKEQTESKQSEQVEEQEEQEPEPPGGSEAEQKEKKPETEEKSEETPIIAGVSQEELQPAIQETQR